MVALFFFHWTCAHISSVCAFFFLGGTCVEVDLPPPFLDATAADAVRVYYPLIVAIVAMSVSPSRTLRAAGSRPRFSKSFLVMPRSKVWVAFPLVLLLLSVKVVGGVTEGDVHVEHGGLAVGAVAIAVAVVGGARVGAGVGVGARAGAADGAGVGVGDGVGAAGSGSGSGVGVGVDSPNITSSLADDDERVQQGEHRVPFDDPSAYETTVDSPSEEDRRRDEADRDAMLDDDEQDVIASPVAAADKMDQPVYARARQTLAEHIWWKLGGKQKNNTRDCAFEDDLRMTKHTMPMPNNFPSTSKQLAALIGKRPVRDLIRHICGVCGAVFPMLPCTKIGKHFADKCVECKKGARFTFVQSASNGAPKNVKPVFSFMDMGLMNVIRGFYADPEWVKNRGDDAQAARRGGLWDGDMVRRIDAAVGSFL